MPRALPPELLAAYRATTYSARTPAGLLRLRVGRRDAGLERLLREMDARTWAFVTACNPRSRQSPPEENGRRMGTLRALVRRRGWPYFDGEGTGDAGDWPAEASLLVLGPDEAEARRLGRRFGQNAVVFGRRGGAVRLLDCRPESAVGKPPRGA